MATRKKAAKRAATRERDPAPPGDGSEGGDGTAVVVAAPLPEEWTPEGGIKIKVKKHVTVATLPFPDDSRLVCQFKSTIAKGKELKETRAGKPKMGPADVAMIMSPAGELRQLVVGTMLKGELEEAYPGGTYVGKWFQISKFAKKIGKDYNTYGIDEIDDPTR